MTAGEKIKKIRLDKGWSLKELSAKCGIRDTTLRKYENGDRNPKYKTAQKIADAFGCSAIAIMDDASVDALYDELSRQDIFLPDEAYEEYLERSKARTADTDYMQRLSVPALKLNEIGRKVLLDNAESLAANEDMTK